MGLTLSDGTTPDSILPQAANFSVFSVFEKSAKEKDYNWNTIAADSRGRTSWIFCPSGSQWRNGATEAFFKKFKRSLKHKYDNRGLNLQEFITALKRIAFILNRRPIYATAQLGSRTSDEFLKPLTSNMLLMGRSDDNGGPVSSTELSLIISSLNRRIRNRDLSAKEKITKRDQFSSKPLHLSDEALSDRQLIIRENNHSASARSKATVDRSASSACVWPGALVYTKKDLNKLRLRETYLVVKIDEQDESYCYIKKFENQCRNKDYKI